MPLAQGHARPEETRWSKPGGGLHHSKQQTAPTAATASSQNEKNRQGGRQSQKPARADWPAGPETKDGIWNGSKGAKMTGKRSKQARYAKPQKC